LALHGLAGSNYRITRVANVSNNSHFGFNGGQHANALYRRLHRDDVPALPGLPILGNLLDFRRDRLALQDRAVKIAPLTGCLVHIPLYVTADADLAHRVLVDDAASYRKSAGLQYLQPLLGEGLLTSENPTHKRHRKLLAPAFAAPRGLRRDDGRGDDHADGELARRR
jgi:cytochrome P450